MATDLFDASPLAQHIAREQAEARDRDLGFGSVVGRESRELLLNRDGSFNVVRRGLGVLDAWAPVSKAALGPIPWPTRRRGHDRLRPLGRGLGLGAASCTPMKRQPQDHGGCH